MLEHGETIHEGLVRGVFEETGLEVKPVSLTGVYQNMPRKVVALVFRCRLVSGELCPNDEATAFRWVSASEVPGLLDEAYAVRVLDALRYDRTASVRAHDGVSLI